MILTKQVFYRTGDRVSGISYFKFIGARAHQEKVNRKIDSHLPVAVSFQNSILDCDGKAFKNGVRPDDTIRQAKLASPLCRIVPVYNATSNELKNILDVLATITPFVEPDDQGCGIFAEVSNGKPLPEIITLLKGMFQMAVVTKSRSKFLAKSSSDWMAQRLFEKRKIVPSKKPWGYVQTGEDYVFINVKQGKESIYSAGMPLSFLWPLPPDAISHLYALGFKTLKDLQHIEANKLAPQIGDWAYLVTDWVNGRDRLPVKPLYPKPYIEKAINIEGIMNLTPQILEPALKEVSEELIQNGTGFKDLSITLSGNFVPVAREKKLARPACRFESLQVIALKLFEEMLFQLGYKVLCQASTILLTFKDIDRVPVKQVSLIQTFDEPKEIRWKGQCNAERSGRYIMQRKNRENQGEGQSNNRSNSNTGVPVSLELVLTGIEEKYGDSALVWGVKDKHKQSGAFKPEILRREKMLAFWDPVRFGKTQAPAS